MFTCHFCGEETVSVGIHEGKDVCYPCCGKLEWKLMQDTGKATLYLVGLTVKYASVQNWCNTLSFKVDRVRHGRHNIAGTRTDVWFRDKSGTPWWGVSYGENTQIVHCRRLKSK